MPAPPANGLRLVIDNTPSGLLHDALIQAITTRHQVVFIYQGKSRIVEPHDYGMQSGRPRLLAYQIGGQSSSGRLPDWRLFEVKEISDFKILEDQFPGNRPAGKHQKWDKVFIRIAERE